MPLSTPSLVVHVNWDAFECVQAVGPLTDPEHLRCRASVVIRPESDSDIGKKKTVRCPRLLHDKQK